ncbi:MAG: MAPEG family protein [Myxococcales bacterium]|nr:MAPEG family protein [Myxococcales bacterium]
MHLEILQPLFALVGLVFLVWLRLFVVRIPLIVHRRTDPRYFRVREGAPPPASERAPTHHLANLFEMPVLFFALVPLLLITGAVDPLQVDLAWGYVAARALHALIHLTYNRPEHRFIPYFIGCVILLVMWLRFAGFILLQG